jgi:hypothetical protein
MKPVLRNVLAVIAGIVGGSLVNMALIQTSGAVIPPPGGADVTTLEGLRAAIPLFEPKHFLFPFLAHALGTLAGAFIAAALAASRQIALALVVGCVFLVGGMTNAMMVPAPAWFVGLDLLAFYLPMALLGARLAPSLEMRNTHPAAAVLNRK